MTRRVHPMRFRTSVCSYTCAVHPHRWGRETTSFGTTAHHKVRRTLVGITEAEIHHLPFRESRDSATRPAASQISSLMSGWELICWSCSSTWLIVFNCRTKGRTNLWPPPPPLPQLFLCCSRLPQCKAGNVNTTLYHKWRLMGHTCSQRHEHQALCLILLRRFPSTDLHLREIPLSPGACSGGAIPSTFRTFAHC